MTGVLCTVYGAQVYLVSFRSQIFDVFLDLVIFAYFNAISIDFYEIKSFICINFV